MATSRSTRRRGLLGQTRIARPLLLAPAKQVHTVGMRCVIDVIWCRADGRILRTARVKPHRVTRVVVRAAFVIEAAAGSCEQWSLHAGDQIEVVDG